MNSSYSAKTKIATVVIVSFAIVLLGVILFCLLPIGRISYGEDVSLTAQDIATTTIFASSTIPEFIVTHIKAPDTVKGVYFTSWAAGTLSFQKKMFELVDGSTEVNTLVIDVKDYSGRISFPMENDLINKIGSVQERIPHIKEMIADLHKKGIYVIGRIAVFQDPFIIKVHPDWAVLDKNTGKQWKDSGGAYWADPTNESMWKYITTIARESYAVGFDEINFDYIRFPSDGAVGSAQYSKLASTTKSSALKHFFSYLHDELSPLGIPISADVFGQTTSDKGDMGIGQYFENFLPYFDYVDPMVYPSHYISGFLNFTKPAEHPYEIVKYEIETATARAIQASTVASTTASSTEVLFTPAKIRPWLQAFDLGAIYTPAMVHEQINANDIAGGQGWLLWNAGSVYNRSFVMPFVVSPKLSTTTLP